MDEYQFFLNNHPDSKYSAIFDFIFQCNCIRCRDPTEMGTYSSALLCSECHQGNVVSSNVDILDAKWKCDKCNFTVGIKNSNLKLQRNIAAVLSTTSSEEQAGTESFASLARTSQSAV